MMRVYHLDIDAIREESMDLAVAISFRPNPNRASQAADLLRRGKYVPVAEIDTASLDDAYRSTQNMDDSWSMQPQDGVRPIGSTVVGRRSSMIGDIIETIKDERVIARHVVDWCGFAEVAR